jgi:hypothetical protein
MVAFHPTMDDFILVMDFIHKHRSHLEKQNGPKIRPKFSSNTQKGRV